MFTLLYILRIKNWLSSYIESLLGQERHYGEKESKTIDMFKYRVWVESEERELRYVAKLYRRWGGRKRMFQLLAICKKSKGFKFKNLSYII